MYPHTLQRPIHMSCIGLCKVWGYMCTCMYVRIYVCVCLHVYVYVCVNIYVCVCIHVPRSLCLELCVMWIGLCKVWGYMCTCMSVCICVCVCVCAYLCVCVYKCPDLCVMWTGLFHTCPKELFEKQTYVNRLVSKTDLYKQTCFKNRLI